MSTAMAMSSDAIPFRPAGPDARRERLVQGSCAALLVSAVTFNAVLALVNGHVFNLSGSIVTAIQGALIAASFSVPVLVRPSGVLRWMVMTWIIVMLFVLLSMLRGVAEVKYLGDVGTIFGFLALGLCIRPRTLATTILALQIVLAVFVLWELVDPAHFGFVFQIEKYYVQTRGFQETSFWSGNANLFVSSQRPEGRLLLPNSGLHRASSLFLEPVSLGNWTIAITVACAALWRVLRRWELLAIIGANVLLQIGCDGRLAMMVNGLLIVSLPLAHLLPRWVPPLFLPVIYILLAVASAFDLLGPPGDDFTGRLSYGMRYLANLDFPALLGLSARAGTVAADSGWAYLIITQSIFGLMLIWFALTVPTGADSPSRRRTQYGIALFLAVALPISFSVFSIKTASLIWMLYGSTFVATARGRETRPCPSMASSRAAVARLDANPASTTRATA